LGDETRKWEQAEGEELPEKANSGSEKAVTNGEPRFTTRLAAGNEGGHSSMVGRVKRHGRDNAYSWDLGRKGL